MGKHRYVASLIAAGTLFLIGTAVVTNRAAVSPGISANGLNINGVIQATNPALAIPVAPPPARPSAVDVPYTKITAPPKNTPAQAQQNDYFDWGSFISALSHGGQSQTSVDTGSSISDAYAFIPANLISAPDVQSLNTMTESQKRLYGWGSDAGNTVQSFENLHQNQVATLTNFMQDREDPDKADAMKKLGADLQAVGDSLDSLNDELPPQMQSAGPGLAEAYREIGRNLAVIPDARGDEALVQAILLYDKSAEAFVAKFVNVVLIFQANDVKFTQDEPGGVFMFPGN